MGLGITFPKIDWPHLDLKSATNLDFKEIADRNSGGIKETFSKLKENFPSGEISGAFSDTLKESASPFSEVGSKVKSKFKSMGISEKIPDLGISDKISSLGFATSDLPTSTSDAVPFLKKLNLPGVTDALNSVPDIGSLKNMSAMGTNDFKNFSISGSTIEKDLGLSGIDTGNSGFNLDSIDMSKINLDSSGSAADLTSLVPIDTSGMTKSTNFDDIAKNLGGGGSVSSMSTDDILSKFSDMGVNTSTANVDVGNPDISFGRKFGNYDSEGLFGKIDKVESMDLDSVSIDDMAKAKSLTDLVPIDLPIDTSMTGSANMDFDPSILDALTANSTAPPKTAYKGPTEVPASIIMGKELTSEELIKGDLTKGIDKILDSINNGISSPDSFAKYFFNEFMQQVKDIKLPNNLSDHNMIKKFDKNTQWFDSKQKLKNPGMDDMIFSSEIDKNGSRDMFLGDRFDRKGNAVGDVSAEEMFKTLNPDQKGLETLKANAAMDEFMMKENEGFDFFKATKNLRLNNSVMGFDYGKHKSLTLTMHDINNSFVGDEFASDIESRAKRQMGAVDTHGFATKVRSGVSGFFTGFVHDSIEGRDKSHDAVFGAITLVGAGFAFRKLDKKYDIISNTKTLAKGSVSGIRNALNMKFGEGVVTDKRYDTQTGKLLYSTVWNNGKATTTFGEGWDDYAKKITEDMATKKAAADKASEVLKNSVGKVKKKTGELPMKSEGFASHVKEGVSSITKSGTYGKTSGKVEEVVKSINSDSKKKGNYIDVKAIKKNVKKKKKKKKQKYDLY